MTTYLPALIIAAVGPVLSTLTIAAGLAITTRRDLRGEVHLP